MSNTRIGVAVAIAAMVMPAAAGAQDGWSSARPDYAWQFPHDHWSHDGYKTEWWYFTGHLTAQGDSVPRFGYQFTFFRVGLLPAVPDVTSSWVTKDLIMGHAAVSDFVTGEHRFSEILYRTTPRLGGFGPFPDSVLGWSASPPGTPGRWTLTWNGTAFDFAARDDRQGFAFSLATRPAKPLIFQGPNGYSRKGAGPTSASQYYSFTRLDTDGTVVVGPDTLTVSGTSWMDKEFGSNQLEEHQAGWDWFSIQLEDGRELMLYVLRQADGSTDHASGTLIGRDGTTTYLGSADWTTRVTRTWASGETGAVYPARWEIEIPEHGFALEIVPLMADQENVSRRIDRLVYWEGAVRVMDRSGRVMGRGYVELTGYVEGARLPF